MLGFCIETKANFKICVEGDANFSIFRYQRVSIGNIKLWHWGFKPTPGSNANGFASQLNIGFKPRTDVAINLLAIDLRLDAQIACNCLQQKFQHAGYLTCNPNVLRRIFN